MAEQQASEETEREAPAAVRPYRLFGVELVRRTTLSPHMARLTFGGEAVGEMRTCAPDQRIKLFFPDPAGRAAALEDRADWYARYKVLPVQDRPPMRTYTIRALRPAAREVDIDFVLHGRAGPASRWALDAQPGDRLQITAPSAAYAGDPGGYEWRPPADVERVLLIADETALPAAAGILEELAARPDPPAAQAFIEVPDPEDALPLPDWPGLDVRWLPRSGAPHGEGMTQALSLAQTPAAASADGPLEAIDIEAVLPWERAAGAADGFYAWVAGESAAVMAIRRELVQARGLARNAINLMGYWRLGRVLD
ncbi:siderophore-interacting protein [Phenylobacterium sp.]|uniref:siderophore-interacting protein n=1 Tax=Phenylobacterium sp. TaxID=1871053 RepID=UPI00301C53FB